MFSCNNVFCRWKINNNPCRITPDIEWRTGETVHDSSENLYVKYGTKIEESKFKTPQGYYLKRLPDPNTPAGKTPYAGVEVTDTVEIQDDGIKVGSKRIFALTDCTIHFRVEPGNNVTEAAVPGTVKWSELNPNNPNPPKLELKTNESGGEIILQNDSGKQFIGHADQNGQYSIKLRDLLPKLDYNIESLGEQPETTVTLYTSAAPKLFSVNASFEDMDNPEPMHVLQQNGKIQIPIVVKRNGSDYYLSGYTVKRQSGMYTREDPQSLEWKAVGEMLHKSKSTVSIDFTTDDHYTVTGIDAAYKKVISTEDSAAVSALRTGMFNAAQVIRNEQVMTWDFEKVFSFDCDLQNIQVLMIGNNQEAYVASVSKTTNRLTLTLPDNALETLRYLRVQSVFNDELTKNPKAFQDFEPFYIYLDGQKPTVSAPETKYQHGWSNKAKFEFCFSVNDDEPANTLTQSDEDQKALRLINQNTNLASVKTIQIGELFFDKPEDGWQSGDVTGQQRILAEADAETGEIAEPAEALPYTITLSPVLNEDESFTGQFKGTLTLTGSDTSYFSSDLPISAEDYTKPKNESENDPTATLKVRIDTAAPKVNSITIDSLTDGMNGERVLLADSGNNLVVHAEATDGTRSSMIRSVEIRYDDRTCKTDKPVNKKDWDDQMIFDADDISRKAKVAVSVTDYAGNTSTYYYARENGEDAVVSKQDLAADVVTDCQPPSDPEFVRVPEPDYETEHGGQKWYQDYPDLPIAAADEGNIRSGIRTVACKINASDWCTINLREQIDTALLSDDELAKQLAAGNFCLRFAPDTADPRTFRAYLCCTDIADIRIPLSGELFRLQNSGKLTAEVCTFDHAGNQSSTAAKDIYIDNTAPTAKTHFTVNGPEDPRNAIAQTLFGMFSSGPVQIRVQISDQDNDVPSSGIKTAELTFAGKTIPGSISKDAHANQTVAEFRLPGPLPEQLSEQSCISGTAVIRVTDNVGHVYESEDLLSEKESPFLMLENKKPILQDPVIEGPDLYTNQAGEKWYSGDVSVTYNVSDPDSGIANVTYQRVQKDNNSTDQTGGSYSGLKQATKAETYSLKTAEQTDGQADFSIGIWDNAGNYTGHTTTVYKDIALPYVSGFEFEDATEFEQSNPGNIVDELGKRYGHFSRKDTVLIVKVRDDRGASAGIRDITVQLHQPGGTQTITEPAVVPNNNDPGTRVAYFLLPEGFKGDIEASATDNVGNSSGPFYAEGFASEDAERHQSTSHIDISLPQTDKRDVSGLPLYNQNVTAKLTAEDSFSGIRRIQWSTSDLDDWQTVEIDRNGNISGEGWTVDQHDRNLAVKASAEFTVVKDANEDFIRLRIEDNSGNTSEETVTFSIDKQAPHITVGGLAPSQQTAYYNRDVTANVAIAERNFANPTVNGTADGGFKADPNTPENTDQYVHAKQFVYNTDGVYSLTIENTDLAGNVTDTPFRSGDFVIDKTAPTAELTFRKQSGGIVDPKKEPYINDAVSASFTVTELNFDPARAVVTINGQNYTPNAKDWKTDQNNVHVLTIPAEQFSGNQHYTVAASAADLAGNTSGTVTAEFIVDTVDPEVEISGYTAANKERIAPVIRTSDDNYADWTLKLTRNGEECTLKADEENNSFAFAVSGTGKTITGHWELLDSGKTRRFTFADFPHEEAFDGSYKLTASVSDQSGRKSSETAEFTVNRFGSVFTVTDYEKINKQHLPQPLDIEIIERNVDLHAEDAEIIVVVDKGSATVQLKGDDYTVSDAKPLDDGSGYEYIYTIKAENFSQDLDYKITISTTDAAGNANVSTNRGAELDFTVDTHVPEFSCDDLFDRAEYRESEKEFRLNVNEPLRSIRVTTSDNEVLLDESDEGLLGLSENSFTFAVPASNSSRVITVELKDLAGNVTKKEFENLLVTENVALYMLHKTWVRKVGTGGIAGVGGIGAFLGIRNVRRKKNGF